MSTVEPAFDRLPQDGDQVPAVSTAPAGRLGSPDEIASAALFLASEESSFVNGSESFADGGVAQVRREPAPIDRADLDEHRDATTAGRAAVEAWLRASLS